jgi:hypothetical protein
MSNCPIDPRTRREAYQTWLDLTFSWLPKSSKSHPLAGYSTGRVTFSLAIRAAVDILRRALRKRASGDGLM